MTNKSSRLGRTGPRWSSQPAGWRFLEASRRAAIEFRARLGSARGDVPGWVLVTVMTAGLVTALWLIADNELKNILAHALAAVSSR